MPGELNEVVNFEVESGFPGKNVVKVTVVEIPFWSLDNFEKLTDQLYSIFRILLMVRQKNLDPSFDWSLVK